MRKVKAWLVTEVKDWVDVFVERPFIAFQSREMAERCMNVRAIRAMGAEDPTWYTIDQIEVVLDD